jgi:flagellar hook assembly protein FlgD
MESEPSDIVEFLSVHSNELPLPVVTQLSGNYPNPFNPTTTISFSIAQTLSFVELEIYNIKGQKVKTLIDEKLPAGNHQVIWNGKDDNSKQAASGIYFYKMKSGNYNETKKMLLLK